MAYSKVNHNVSNIEIRPATTADVIYVGKNLRPADFEEYIFSTGRHPAKAFAKSLRGYDDLHCGTSDGVPAAIFGCHWGDHSGGTPWFMGTEAIEGLAVARLMVTHGRKLFANWAKTFGPLRHHVYAENKLHIRYIRALGCTFGEPVERGPFNQQFIPFTYSQGG